MNTSSSRLLGAGAISAAALLSPAITKADIVTVTASGHLWPHGGQPDSALGSFNATLTYDTTKASNIIDPGIYQAPDSDAATYHVVLHTPDGDRVLTGTSPYQLSIIDAPAGSGLADSAVLYLPDVGDMSYFALDISSGSDTFSNTAIGNLLTAVNNPDKHGTDGWYLRSNFTAGNLDGQDRFYTVEAMHAAVVPTPASAALLGLVAAGSVFVRRRRSFSRAYTDHADITCGAPR